ncbi:MAG: hypothetical protein ACYC0B_00210 [Gemmatimonadaceae bacterium]
MSSPRPSALPAALLAVAVLGLGAPAAKLLAQASEPRGPTIAVLAHHARVRSALDDLVLPERSVPQLGLEVTAPTFWRPLRVTSRMLRSTRGGNDLHSFDAGMLLSVRFLSLEAAYARRGSYSPETGLAHGRTAEFARAGFRARADAGSSGFIMHLRGNAYVPTRRADVAEDEIEGWDAESGLTYVPRALPVTATLGYRLERFRIFGVEQEVSALTFALGVALLGH